MIDNVKKYREEFSFRRRIVGIFVTSFIFFRFIFFVGVDLYACRRGFVFESYLISEGN